MRTPVRSTMAQGVCMPEVRWCLWTVQRSEQTALVSVRAVQAHQAAQKVTFRTDPQTVGESWGQYRHEHPQSLYRRDLSRARSRPQATLVRRDYVPICVESHTSGPRHPPWVSHSLTSVWVKRPASPIGQGPTVRTHFSPHGTWDTAVQAEMDRIDA